MQIHEEIERGGKVQWDTSKSNNGGVRMENMVMFI
jgi:hypothetical protein